MYLRIFGSKRDEMTVAWRKLYKEKLNDLYCSRGFSAWFWWGNLRERDHLEYLVADWRIILRWQWFGDMDWINLIQDRDRWWPLVH